jgi:O-antigen/teichoic acid export membrane protein
MLFNIKNWLNRFSKKSLVRNTLWMLMAQGLRIVLQAFYFVLIARALGADQYGAFVGATAFVAIFAPFASLGGGNLLIKNVSRNRELFNEYWGNALLMILVSGLILIGFILLASPLILPKTISLLMLSLIAVTDLIFARILDTAGQAFQSVLWLSKTAQLNILPQVTRLIVAFAFIHIFPKAGALEWAVLYLASTSFCAVFGILLVHRCLGTPKLALSRITPEITEGFYFSISLSAQTIYNDIDKTMLARLSTLEATGIYAAAYRLIDVAFVPVRSLLYAAYAKFFQQGSKGIQGSLDLAKRLLPFAGIYGVIAGLGLFFCAPIVPSILGDEYRGAVEALRWLAPLPFLKAMHYFAADMLTGANFQRLRSAVQVMIAVLNILFNVWLIPLYSWKGAAWASLISDGFLMLSLWFWVAFFYQQQIQNIKANK